MSLFPFCLRDEGIKKKKKEKNAWSQVRLVEWNTSGAIFKSVIGSQDLVGRQFSPGSLYQFNLFAWHLTMGFLPPPPPPYKKKNPPPFLCTTESLIQTAIALVGSVILLVVQRPEAKRGSIMRPGKAILFFFSVYRRPTDLNFWHFQKKKERSSYTIFHLN